MALEYPLPATFRTPVVKVRAKAEQAFRETVDKLQLPSDRRSFETAATTYVTTVTLAFAHQACEATRADKLRADQIDSAVERFIRNVTVHAYDELDLKRCWSSWEFFRRDADPAIKESKGWDEHLDEVTGVPAPRPEGSGDQTENRREPTSRPCSKPRRISAKTRDRRREVVATVASPHQTTPTTAVELDTAENRRRAVDAYIAEVREKTGKTITRKDIWQHAHYKDATEFERWQRCAPKTTKTAGEVFMRFLKEKPHLQ